MLSLKLLQWSYSFFSAEISFYSIKWSRWHPGTGRNWSLLDRSLQEESRGAGQVPPALLTPLGALLEPMDHGLGRRDRRVFTDGQRSHKWHFLTCFVSGISRSLFSALTSSVASLSLFSCWKEGFPVLFCSFTQYLWYCCVLLSSESERRQKKGRYCLLFVELLHRPSAIVTVLQVVHFSEEATEELRQLWDSFSAAYRVLNNRNVINQRFWSSNPRHIIFSRRKGLLLMDKILVRIFGL